ncbi:histone-lysine N-methyltransferase EHMT2-like isoform X1 [Haliotis rufescens]|uniref:histone-lysine N-methyltransferase EHMT2-like isoform X1 n=1 Tax=Haliotis rufescens TaxID=6454 RepID=UPI00201EAA0D|nr:histone-lysine N-methyltransferase EHMT2-like isoform X1 [Haliotis rufescens]
MEAAAGGATGKEKQDAGPATNCIFCMTDPSGRKGWETRWLVTAVPDKVMSPPPVSAFTELGSQMKEQFLASLVAAWKGSMVFCFVHQSQEDAINMIIRHSEVKRVILHFLQTVDPSLRDIRMEVELRELGRPAEQTAQKSASSNPSEREAGSPGTSQESDLPATSREEETQESGTPLGRSSDTPATPTPTFRDPKADSDLHEACWKGDLAAVQRILTAGRADINCRDESKGTPVIGAARGGHREVVEFLVSEGADVSLVDCDGNNTLHFACMAGDVEMVKFVLSLNVVVIDTRNNYWQTATDMARLWGHQLVMDLLESRGA